MIFRYTSFGIWKSLRFVYDQILVWNCDEIHYYNMENDHPIDIFQKAINVIMFSKIFHHLPDSWDGGKHEKLQWQPDTPVQSASCRGGPWVWHYAVHSSQRGNTIGAYRRVKVVLKKKKTWDKCKKKRGLYAL